MTTVNILTFFSALSFLFFGIASFTTAQMKAEFKRYGLAKFRRIVGGLQFVGALGLMLGYFYSPKLQGAAALGLFILMTLGFIVRLKIKDSFFQAVPSFMYAVLNAVIFLMLL